MDSSLPSLTARRGSLAGLPIEKCKQKAKMPNMAFDMHGKRVMKDAIDESKGRANLWPIAAGAMAGALAGYVLSTPRGRHVLDEVIVMLEDFSSGCARFSQACARAQLSASESWNAVTNGFTSKSIRTR